MITCPVPTTAPLAPRWGAPLAWAPPRPPTTLRSISRFRPRTDADLYALPPEALLAYVAQAKRAGATADAERAMHMLFFRYEPRMRSRIRKKLPKHLAHHEDTVAEWVLERVLRSALKLALKGESVGEWVVWWRTAVDRQVISFWRSSQGQALERETSLPSEHQGEESPSGTTLPDTLGVDFDADGLVDRVLARDIIGGLLDAMENRQHVEIVRLRIYDDLPSTEVAERCNTTANNVDQVLRRFRDDLKDACEGKGMGR